jgi:UDP-glucose 4-epimerase
MRWIIIGGAGCIGSHFVDVLIRQPGIEMITIYDNFSSGREWHYEHHIENKKLTVVRGDVEDKAKLKYYMFDNDAVIHLASNPDISKAINQPDIDFWQGTALTNHILEAMRITNVKRLLYASGSGVYGDIGETEGIESMILQPISTYGASKLSGEALIRSYCHMFGFSACAFRFGNVVGARQTHGVGLDFLKRLLKDSSKLTILGDGNQSKSYVHISDIVKAVLLVNKKVHSDFHVYNVATQDYITVNEIADLAIECLGLTARPTIFRTGGARGWQGDVPVVRLNSDAIRSLGWCNAFSTKEAVKKSMTEMLPSIKEGKM